MSVYYGEFRFAGKSNLDYGLRVVSFDGGQIDQDSYLGMDAIYTDNYDGTQRYDYGAKFNTVATPEIGMIKADGTDITVSEFREIAKWLTGVRVVKALDFLGAGQEVLMTFFGRFTGLTLKKLDARLYGIVATFDATSPWAFSGEVIISRSLSGSETINIYNDTDDLYSYIYPTVEFTNSSPAVSFIIQNMTIGESSVIDNLTGNEVVTILPQHIISSDKITRVFGSDFNFIWPKLQPGDNIWTVSGTGALTIKYRTPMKVADALADIADTVQCI